MFRCIYKNSLYYRIKNFVISWGSALFFLYFFYPIKFLHPVNPIKNGLADSVSVDIFDPRSVICFFGLLIYLQCFLKKDVNAKKYFYEVFLIYAGLLIVMFSYSYFKCVFMPTQIVAFCCFFLPATFFSVFFEEETFMKINKILCWGLLVFFSSWQILGRFIVGDYLGFLTLLLFAIIYALTKNLKIFYLLYILFNIYVFFQFEKRFYNGLGQIFVIYISVFIFLLYKKYYWKLCLCLGCVLLVFIPNHNFNYFYKVAIYKINFRIGLIENKGIENKTLKNLFLITPYKGKLLKGSTDAYFRYPHNTFIEAFMVFGPLGLIWYLAINMISFVGLKQTKHKDFFIVMFLALTLISLKQGSILSQRLLTLFHVFGIKMFLITRENLVETRN